MKVLIIKLGALGDIIMATPVISTLCATHARDQLFLLTASEYAGLFEDWPGLKLIHFARRGIRASLASTLWLRRQGFDRIYDLQSNDRSRIMCCLSTAREIVGTHNTFPYTHHPGDRYTGQCHILERYRQVLRSAGISLEDERPWLPVPATATEKVSAWLEQQGLAGERLVLMHAGASPLHPGKRWPYFSSLAAKLKARGLAIIWIGAGADAEINRALAEDAGVDATNQFSVAELVALGKRAAFALTNDSGPMHVLACAGLPVFSLFGPTDWRRHHAIGQQGNVISLDRLQVLSGVQQPASPGKSDLSLLSVEMVWEVLVKGARINQ